LRILSPKPRHIEDLTGLSQDFAGETEWASTIPIGRVGSKEEAASRLFGPEVLMARVAETESGEMIGYFGVYRHPEAVHMSILVKAGYRRSGVGKQLVEAAFREIPEGLEVEAWVGAFNEASLSAVPRLGFDLTWVIEDRGRTVYVFTWKSG
jgi:GNAT superfamily N-acetyltransferase